MEAAQLPDPIHQERVVNLYLAALACPPEQRDSFVAEACSGDDRMRAEVRRRVDWEVRMGGFLLTPVVARERFDRPFAAGETVLGRFRILRVAGEGGMGVVYEALDEKLNRRVALKCPHFEFRKRLSPEARNSLLVAHRNVCRVFEIHTAETNTGDVDFLTMEFVDGETLTERLKSVPPGWLQTKEGAAIAQQLCDGLRAVHDRGVVHRDLKSGNIMLSADGRAVIMDFGIAQGSEFLSSQIRGTRDYVAPEIWLGHGTSPRSDIYALGVLLHEMACGGRKPFTADAEWRERLRDVPAIRDIAQPARPVIRRCLQPDPAKRYANAGEVATALRTNVSRRRLLIGGTAAAALSAIAVKTVYWPASPVRIAILPPPAGTGPLAEGVLNDIAYRLRTLRGARRPVWVFGGAELEVGKVTDLRSAAALGATHLIETSRTDTGIRSDLYEVPSGTRVMRAECGLAPSALQDFQSTVVRAVIERLHLRTEYQPQFVSGDTYATYLQGMHYARVDYKNAAMAIPYFEKVIKEAPKSALGYAGLAEARINASNVSGDLSQLGLATEAISKAEQLDPQSGHVHTIAARLARHAGNYQRALSEAQRAVEIDPQDVEARIGMGYDLFYLNRLAESEAALLAAARVQPGYYKPYLDTGLFYYETGDFRRAEEQWNEAFRLAPGLSLPRLNLAMVYQPAGRPAEALRMAQSAVALRRTGEELEMLGDLQSPAEAVATYEEALREGPVSYSTWGKMGDTYLAMHREADAMGAFRSGLHFIQDRLRDRPSDPEIIAWCAYYHARLGETAMARARVEETEKLKNQQGSVRKRLIFTYGWLNDIDAANRWLTGATADLIKELRIARDVPPALRADPRFTQD